MAELKVKYPVLFRKLTEEEEEDFREYARENSPDLAKWELLHPVCRAEWIRRGQGPVEVVQS